MTVVLARRVAQYSDLGHRRTLVHLLNRSTPPAGRSKTQNYRTPKKNENKDGRITCVPNRSTTPLSGNFRPTNVHVNLYEVGGGVMFQLRVGPWFLQATIGFPPTCFCPKSRDRTRQRCIRSFTPQQIFTLMQLLVSLSLASAMPRPRFH